VSTFELPPFPILMDVPVEPWRWPKVPFDWRHVPPPDADVAQPCRIETPTGAAVQGFLVGLDPAARTIAFRTSSTAPALDLPFARFQRLTLTTPLSSIDATGRGGAERVPIAAQQREYRLQRADGIATGRTCGHVENEAGLFLFTPGGDEHSLVREFIPRTAYHRVEFGDTALDAAADKWISTKAELLAAFDRQQRMSIRPIGQSLIELGMVTREQLERMLAQPNPELPLGERMVAAGLISRNDLHTAIAYKMGYPFVDLSRFPVEAAAARKLPLRMAVKHRALPIMADRDRLFVAVDRPVRIVPLQGLYALAPFTVVPVIASKGQLMLALTALSGQDLWSEHVSVQANFFAPTNA
jgi:hypothetical protein